MNLIENWFRGCYLNYRGSDRSLRFMWKRSATTTHHKKLYHDGKRLRVECWSYTDGRGVHDRYGFAVQGVSWREVLVRQHWYSENWVYPNEAK